MRRKSAGRKPSPRPTTKPIIWHLRISMRWASAVTSSLLSIASASKAPISKICADEERRWLPEVGVAIVLRQQDARLVFADELDKDAAGIRIVAMTAGSEKSPQFARFPARIGPYEVW